MNAFSRSLKGQAIGEKKLFWGMLLAAMLLRYGYYGFTYFPVLDDNNAYGVFSMMSPFDVFAHYKSYTTRPLAAVLDAFGIARFWDCLWVVLLFTIVLHFLCCVLVYKISEKNNLRTGIVLSVILALFPLGNDATYWLAASSRIVFGMFFALLSAYLLMLFIEYKKAGRKNTLPIIICFWVTNLLSLGFYEQIIVLSLVINYGILAYNFKGLKGKWVALIPLLNLAIIAIFYIYFRSSGNVATRGQIVSADYIGHTMRVFTRIRDLLTLVPAKMIKNGIINGFHLIFTDKAFIFLILALLAGAGIGLLYAKENSSHSLKAAAVKLVIGLVLILAPFAPFFLLNTIWISLRNTFTSFIGIGLVAEAIIGLIPRNNVMNILRGTAVGIGVTLFIIINAAEVYDYRAISSMDTEVVRNINKVISTNANIDFYKERVIVLNAKQIYITPASPHYANATASDWALQGAFEANNRELKTPRFLPVVSGTTVELTTEELSNGVFIGLENDRNAVLLMSRKINDNDMELTTTDGTVFGVITVQSGNKFVFTKK